MTVDLCMTSTMCQLSPKLLCEYILFDKSGLTNVCAFV